MNINDLNGKYPGKAIEWGLGEAGNGSLQIGVLFELTPNEAMPAGVRITWYGSFTNEKATEFTFKALRAMGWKGTDPDELDTPAADLNANEVELDIQPDTYNGKTTTKVQWVNKLGSGGLALKNRLTPEKKASFAEQMRGRFLALDAKDKAKAAGTAPVVAAAPQAKPPAGFDDIPF